MLLVWWWLRQQFASDLHAQLHKATQVSFGPKHHRSSMRSYDRCQGFGQSWSVIDGTRHRGDSAVARYVAVRPGSVLRKIRSHSSMVLRTRVTCLSHRLAVPCTVLGCSMKALRPQVTCSCWPTDSTTVWNFSKCRQWGATFLSQSAGTHCIHCMLCVLRVWFLGM